MDRSRRERRHGYGIRPFLRLTTFSLVSPWSIEWTIIEEKGEKDKSAPTGIGERKVRQCKSEQEFWSQGTNRDL